ncbi:hypothetical protein CGLAU_03425 [Corynebacterium glaucum]|uniref:Uncharacterized protein n=1 Tax=Corynebacterium glaucum TaxID=187491 RepID=A0A1Q2HUZ1_9CORY|nr:hypothetical protein [Corynebacterium glaucum]AQQ14665.1 hypothetical protein CGLAU_03425 [Corynebacterium glaucum]
MHTISYPAIVTFWFVTTADPGSVLDAEPKADRGFGRKLLAQINPTWPITPIGEFPLNRSSKPGRDEFYIAGYPGVAVVQTFVADSEKLTETVGYLREALPAAETYMFAEGTDSDYAGFAHYVGENLRRSLTATREQVLEDIGLPEPFEAPYWAGEKAEQLGGITLPFEPKDLVREAQKNWIGIDLEPGAGGPDVHVVGYAIDGRPEPKIAKKQEKKTKTVNEVAVKFAEKDKAYDDYEAAGDTDEGNEFAELADASVAAARRVGRSLRRRLGQAKDSLQERLRNSDR